MGWDGLLAVTGADRLSVPPEAVGAFFLLLGRGSRVHTHTPCSQTPADERRTTCCPARGHASAWSR
jgi:hypothetical protein